MDFSQILGMASAMSLAVERAMEVVKIGYLKVKNSILPKKQSSELTSNEKVILTILVSIIAIALGGKSVLLPIPGVVTLPTVFQIIISGLIVSIGSNVLHTMYTMLMAIKSNIEGVSNMNTTCSASTSTSELNQTETNV